MSEEMVLEKERLSQLVQLLRGNSWLAGELGALASIAPLSRNPHLVDLQHLAAGTRFRKWEWLRDRSFWMEILGGVRHLPETMPGSRISPELVPYIQEAAMALGQPDLVDMPHLTGVGFTVPPGTLRGGGDKTLLEDSSSSVSIPTDTLQPTVKTC